MSKSFDEIRRQELQTQRDDLIQEYQALSGQRRRALSEADRVRMDREMLDCEKNIRGVEQELRAASAPVLDNSRPEIEVQVAVVAMKKSEADALEVIADPESLQQLMVALQTYNVGELSSCYGERRDDWKPLLVDGKVSINAIITEVVDHLNRASAGVPGRAIIRVRSLSEQFLAESSADRTQAWDALEESGGVVVVDAISMFHPTLRQHFLNSQLISANNSVGVVVLSPLKAQAVSVNEILRARVYTVHLERAFSYFSVKLDPLYEFGVADICNLKRWLFAVLPNIRRVGLSPEMRAAIQAQVGITPRGIAAIISGS